MSYQKTRVRLDAIPAEARAVLCRAGVGGVVHLTFYGVPSDVMVTELTDEWVQVESLPGVDLWAEAETVTTTAAPPAPTAGSTP